MPATGSQVVKRCTRCERICNEGEFWRNATRHDGLSNWCRDCHREATRTSREKYREGYNAARRTGEYREEKACINCATVFTARNPTALICGSACKRAIALKRTGVAVTCANCGKDFLKPRRGVERYPVHYCGRRCHALASKGPRLNAWKLAALRIRLDKAITAVTAQPSLALPVAALSVSERCRPAPEVCFTAGCCAECNAPFVSTRRGTRYCCDEHAARAIRRRSKGRRDKRIRAGNHEPISLAAVAKRDGWRCHICHRKVTRLNWSLDHLVPLSDNGTHTYDNVALAHHRCNTLRGATGHAQLLLVG